MTRILKRLLALCACLALLAGAACAEDITVLCTGEEASLGYDCTLPDGRLLLSGVRGSPADGTQKAWLVCMNPDRTVSWEYVETEEGECWYTRAVLLKDGTIAMVWTRYHGDSGKVVAKFLTQDGKPTGKETVMPDETLWPYEVSSSYLLLERQMYEEGKEEEPWFEMMVADWDGNVLVPWQNESAADSGLYRMLEEEDGVVFYGMESMKPGRAKILKKDRPQGSVIWENALYKTWPEIPEPEIIDLVKTEDGGYAALIGQLPSAGENGELTDDGYDYIVKLDADGTVRWIHRADPENGDHCCALAAVGGKLVTCAAPKVRWDPRMDHPLTVSWFDLDGNRLGNTELKLDPADFPLVQEALASEDAAGKPATPVVAWGGFVPMADGLRIEATCFVLDTDDENADGVLLLGGDTTVLARIPEI